MSRALVICAHTGDPTVGEVSLYPTEHDAHRANQMDHTAHYYKYKAITKDTSHIELNLGCMQLAATSEQAGNSNGGKRSKCRSSEAPDIG